MQNCRPQRCPADELMPVQRHQGRRHRIPGTDRRPAERDAGKSARKSRHLRKLPAQADPAAEQRHRGGQQKAHPPESKRRSRSLTRIEIAFDSALPLDLQRAQIGRIGPVAGGGVLQMRSRSMLLYVRTRMCVIAAPKPCVSPIIMIIRCHLR